MEVVADTDFNNQWYITKGMRRDGVLDRVLGSRLTTVVAARPRAALTVGMLALLLLAGDPASAETLDAGTTSVGDASEGP